MATIEHKVDRLNQQRRSRPKRGQMLLCLRGEKNHSFPSTLDTQEGHEVNLSRILVFFDRLSKRFLIPLNIKKVVDDLKGKTEIRGEARNGLTLMVMSPAQQRPHFPGEGDHGPGLQSLHPGEDLKGILAIDLGAHVDHLTADHSAGAGGMRHPFDQPTSHDRIPVRFRRSHDLECER
jgi:hypothetical protein